MNNSFKYDAYTHFKAKLSDFQICNNGISLYYRLNYSFTCIRFQNILNNFKNLSVKERDLYSRLSIIEEEVRICRPFYMVKPYDIELRKFYEQIIVEIKYLF